MFTGDLPVGACIWLCMPFFWLRGVLVCFRASGGSRGIYGASGGGRYFW